MSELDLIRDASPEQLGEHTKIAAESGAKNLTAKLPEIKKERFPEYGKRTSSLSGSGVTV